MKKSRIHEVRQLMDLYLAWRRNESHKPLKAELLVTSKCNSCCLICNVWKLNDAKPELVQEELATDEWVSLLEELSEMGTQSIFISVGEPTLIDDLTGIIRFAKEKDICVDLVTNGFLVTKSLAEELVDCGVDRISFSIDAPIPEIHDEIRGIEGSWKRAIKAIKLVSNARKETRSKTPKINVSYVVTIKSYPYIEDMIDLKSDVGFDTINFQPIIGKVSEADRLFLKDEDIKKLQQSLRGLRRKTQ